MTDRLRNGIEWAPIVAESGAMKDVLDKALRPVRHKEPLLITGETGVGKDTLAKYIYEKGGRRSGEFVLLDPAAAPEIRRESILFGNKKGAFTGVVESRIGLLETAQGGTLFINDGDDFSIEYQTAFLRFMDYKEVRPVGDTQSVRLDVRVIAATKNTPGEQVEAGKFRRNLFYRLNVLPILIPPLRERPEDVEPLFEHFSCKYSDDDEGRRGFFTYSS